MRREQGEAAIKGFSMNFLRVRLLPLIAAILLVCGAGVYSVGVVTAAQKTRSAHSKKPTQFYYVCPMHEDVTSKTRGKKCPKCKMKLERRALPEQPSQ
jgi:hypothetical protein